MFRYLPKEKEVPPNNTKTSPFTKEQEERIIKLTTIVVTKALAPILAEIRALRNDVNEIKQEIIRLKKDNNLK
ncbi:MAG: hypothetical protein HUJ52_02325 [Malacoplasma sp.]|nr:hypothetical protein [Malacoplasma sp.]